MEKIAIVVCLHGDESYGLEVIKKLPDSLPSFIANKKALKEKKRFIDSDLNRSFPGSLKGDYEEKLSFDLIKKLKRFDKVIDLHSTSGRCPLFGIITKPNNEKINIAKKLGLNRVVLMPENFGSGKSLIDHVNCGISLEIGPHKRKKNVSEVLEKINNFLKNKDLKNGYDIKFFEVIDIIKQEYEKITVENFRPVKKGDVLTENRNDRKQIAEYDFVPILVGEKSYPGILCLASKKIDL